MFFHVPGSWFLMGQHQSFIQAPLDWPLAYHKVKGYGKDPKQQRPIISQGNWLLIGNNNRTDWEWLEKDRQRERKNMRESEGSIKNDWSMSQQTYWLDKNRNGEGAQFTYIPTGTGRLPWFAPSSISFFSPDFFFSVFFSTLSLLPLLRFINVFITVYTKL